MRTLLSLLVLAATVLAIPTAQARDPDVSLAVSSLAVGYGKPVRLAGVVSSRRAGVPVSIIARSFTRAGFDEVARATTGPGGRWTATVKPSIGTTYRARVGTGISRLLTVGVHPTLSLQLLDNGSLRVQAAAGRNFNGRSVKLQRMTPTGWSTITQLSLGQRSTAVVPSTALPAGTSKLRAVMSVNQAGVGYLGGFSAPLVYPARWVSAALSSPEVVQGEPVTLAGRVSLNQPGLQVTILSRSLTKPQFQKLATVRTGADGRWALRTTPKIGTAYQAQFRNAMSRVVAVGLHPTVKARIVAGARLWVHVGAGRSFAGRDVQVQQLQEGTWVTIGKRSLNRRSETVFPAVLLPGGTNTLRVVMSVNQAGSGFLGAIGRSFVYQR